MIIDLQVHNKAGRAIGMILGDILKAFIHMSDHMGLKYTSTYF